MFISSTLRIFFLSIAFGCSLVMSLLSQAEDTVTSPPNSSNLIFIAGQKYYILPDGTQLRDDRRVGSLYPNIFDVIRKDTYGEHIVSEDEDAGCNLETLFRTTIFKQSGFDARRYLHALSTTATDCKGLSASDEMALCQAFNNKTSCEGVIPLALKAIPLPAGSTYLNYKVPFTCQLASETILKETLVPQESVEWQKISRDVSEKKKAEYQKSLKSKVPTEELKQKVLSTNAYASQRDFDFAANDWLYNETRKFEPIVLASEVQPIAEKRYSPHGAIYNLISFKSEIGGNCKGLDIRYKNKVYAEAQNIPPHDILLFSDFVNRSNHCICN